MNQLFEIDLSALTPEMVPPQVYLRDRP